MKKYFLYVIFPAIVIIFLVNTIVNNPEPDNPSEYIYKAVATRNYGAAKSAYRKLIESDFENIENHREYIRVSSYITDRNSGNNRQQYGGIRGFYETFAESEDVNTADIGNYCRRILEKNLAEFRMSVM